MKRKSGNSAATETAIDWCLANKIEVLRPTASQLKVGDLTYFPASGALQRDGEVLTLKRGFRDFQALVMPETYGQVGRGPIFTLHI